MDKGLFLFLDDLLVFHIHESRKGTWRFGFTQDNEIICERNTEDLVFCR